MIFILGANSGIGYETVLALSTASADFHIKVAEHMILRDAAQKVPRDLRSWTHYKPTIAAEKRINRALLYDKPGTVEHNVAWCFRVSAAIDYEVKRALIWSLPSKYARRLEETQNDSGDVSLVRIAAYFHHYLASIEHRQAQEGKPVRRPDPFSKLLEALPQRMRIWAKDTAPAEEAGRTTVTSKYGDW